MTAGNWRVETRTSVAQSWANIVDRVNRRTAEETAEFYAIRYPLRTLRLQDMSTGQIVHLGGDGKPLRVGPPVMRRDIRTPEQVQADVAADRYEASLERGTDL